MTSTLGRSNTNSTERSYLSIREVLELLIGDFPDITISKIRFLEACGLIHPERTPSGYRKFYREDVERLRWILRQQRENYLPLNVIKVRLDGGQALSESETAEASLFDDAPFEPPPTADSIAATPFPEAPSAPAAPTPMIHRGHPAAGTLSTRRIGLVKDSPIHLHAGDSVNVAPSPAPVRTEPARPEVASAEAPRTEPGTRFEPTTPFEPASSEAPRSVPVVAAAPESAPVVAAEPTTAAVTPPVMHERPVHVPEPQHVPTTPVPAPSISASAEPATSVPATSVRGANVDVVDGYSSSELARAIGSGPEFVNEIANYGLICGREVAGEQTFDDQALQIAQLAYNFSAFGIEPRHLKSLQHAAIREAELFSQVVVPLLRQRNPEARDRAQSNLAELVSLGASLKSGFIQSELRNLTGG